MSTDIVERAREEAAYLRGKDGIPLATPTTLDDCADAITALRAALIESGRAVGGGLADTVSTEFLLHVPTEVGLVTERLRARVEELEADKARLDYLDSLNVALNARYGTKYSWELIINHNVNRLHFKHMSVDLNDAAPHGFPSCRVPIDRAMAEYAARRALAKGGE